MKERDATGRFHVASSRSLYMPIQAIEPFGPMAGRWLGYDVYTEAALTDAIQQAVASGKVAASSPTVLLQSEPSLIVFKAVYQGRYIPDNTAERQALLQGLMALELPARFMTDLLMVYPEFGIQLVYHGMPQTSREATESFYAREAISRDEPTWSWWPRWHVQRMLNIYGQPFQLRLSYQAIPNFSLAGPHRVGIVDRSVVSLGVCPGDETASHGQGGGSSSAPGSCGRKAAFSRFCRDRSRLVLGT
ncbi:hypothetical protein C2W62_23385 [Candidatus Entotheonella serta]|nr:hypothetical protein C2W62_23385 [Candidatus Entotheonella serta]